MSIKFAFVVFLIVLINVSTSSAASPPLICLPLICDLKCDYGLAKDGNGCDVCRCANPCETVKCSAGYECQVEELQCLVAPCPFHGVCRPVCKPLPCRMNCEFGLATDSRGCNICKCNNPCQKKICPPGTVCKAEQAMCIWQPCAPIVTCVPKCKPVLCEILCLGGFAKDANGCEICSCQDPCKTMVCEAGTVCRMVDVQCIRAPCPPIPMCVVPTKG